MERDGYPTVQSGLHGAKLANFVPGKQEKISIKNCTGDQEKSYYGAMASTDSSLKTAIALDASLNNLQMLDQMQCLLKMKPGLIPLN